MDNEEIISTLNDLIVCFKEGEEGLKACAEDLEKLNPDLKSVLLERQRACSIAVYELQNLVRAQGGAPESGGSISGALHRAWVNIKTAIRGTDDETVLTECERYVDLALKLYAGVLEQDLPAHIGLVVERQYQAVLRDYEQIKALREQVEVQA